MPTADVYPSTVVVVPTIREDCIVDFLAAWCDELADAQVLIVEDNPAPSFGLGTWSNIIHYSWEDVERDLGAKAWIIPRRTDCVRSYGLWKAWQLQPDMIVTLDDDCYPDPTTPGYLRQHWDRLNEQGQDDCWVSSGEGVLPRGIPYFERARHRVCVLNHGLWSRVIDFDAPTQLLQARDERPFVPIDQTFPDGKYFPMCGMNIAFRPLVSPALYFLLMGRDYPYDRFGDIWSGILLKRICDHLGYAINSGRPHIVHQRASNVFDNLRKEAPGLRVNEKLWSAVDATPLTGTTVAECYAQLARVPLLAEPYFEDLQRAMLEWVELFR